MQIRFHLLEARDWRVVAALGVGLLPAGAVLGFLPQELRVTSGMLPGDDVPYFVDTYLKAPYLALGKVWVQREQSLTAGSEVRCLGTLGTLSQVGR